MYQTKKSRLKSKHNTIQRPMKGEKKPALRDKK